MSRYTLICPECHAENSLSARRLLVRVDEGTATSGEALFTSACADAAIAAYLISATTPARGTKCDQDLVPWVDFGAGGP